MLKNRKKEQGKNTITPRNLMETKQKKIHGEKEQKGKHGENGTG